MQNTLDSSYTVERELAGGGMSRVFFTGAVRVSRMNEDGPDHDAMLEWQERQHEHVSSVNTQFLTYAGTLLGLEEAQLFTREGSPLKSAAAFEVAGVFAGLSFAIGSIVVLIRLRDARLTARMARLIYEDRHAPKIDALRRSSEVLSQWTNRLMPGQVVTFFLAVAAMICWIVILAWK